MLEVAGNISRTFLGEVFVSICLPRLFFCLCNFGSLAILGPKSLILMEIQMCDHAFRKRRSWFSHVSFC